MQDRALRTSGRSEIRDWTAIPTKDDILDTCDACDQNQKFIEQRTHQSSSAAIYCPLHDVRALIACQSSSSLLLLLLGRILLSRRGLLLARVCDPKLLLDTMQNLHRSESEKPETSSSSTQTYDGSSSISNEVSSPSSSSTSASASRGGGGGGGGGGEDYSSSSSTDSSTSKEVDTSHQLKNGILSEGNRPTWREEWFGVHLPPSAVARGSLNAKDGKDLQRTLPNTEDDEENSTLELGNEDEEDGHDSEAAVPVEEPPPIATIVTTPPAVDHQKTTPSFSLSTLLSSPGPSIPLYPLLLLLTTLYLLKQTLHCLFGFKSRTRVSRSMKRVLFHEKQFVIPKDQLIRHIGWMKRRNELRRMRDEKNKKDECGGLDEGDDKGGRRGGGGGSGSGGMNGSSGDI